MVLTTLTVDLLSAYFANNIVPSENLADLIRSTRAALAEADAPAEAEAKGPAHVPAVSVRKSLASHEHIISMIDGKPYKTLKRHAASHGLSPAEYRERYKLAPDYPMVARAYSEQRRAVAEKLGLGRSRGARPQAAASVSTPEAAPQAKSAAATAQPKAARKAKSAAVAKAPVIAKAPAVAKASAPAKSKPGPKPKSAAAQAKGTLRLVIPSAPAESKEKATKPKRAASKAKGAAAAKPAGTETGKPVTESAS